MDILGNILIGVILFNLNPYALLGSIGPDLLYVISYINNYKKIDFRKGMLNSLVPRAF